MLRDFYKNRWMMVGTKLRARSAARQRVLPLLSLPANDGDPEMTETQEIVERLRAKAIARGPGETTNLLNDAAELIERLQRVVDSRSKGEVVREVAEEKSAPRS